MLIKGPGRNFLVYLEGHYVCPYSSSKSRDLCASSLTLGGILPGARYLPWLRRRHKNASPLVLHHPGMFGS